MSIQDDFNLYCSRSYLLSIRQVVFFLGQLSSSLTSGYLSDSFGRKSLMLIMMFLWTVSSLLHIPVEDYTIFLTLQFILAYRLV